MAIAIPTHNKGTLLTVGNRLVPLDLTGCVGFWTFGEGSGTTLYDRSGNGNDGTIYGATWVWDTIRKKYVLSFDGVDDYIVLSNTVGDGQPAITISLWIKANSLNNDTLTSHVDGSSPIASTDSDDAWLIAEGSGELDFYTDTGTNNDLITNGLGLQTGTWYHITATYDGSYMRLYVNATEIANMSASGSIINPGNTQYIGFAQGRAYRWAEAFDGIITLVCIYNRALTQTEITNLYNKTRP